MPAYQVERSILIDAPETKVRPAIKNFAEWPKWSPRLCMEPAAQVDVHGTPGQAGHAFSWEGDVVGTGSMQIISVEGTTQRMQMEFLKPFRSRAEVAMKIKPVGEGQTEVTWQVDGKMPFFFIFMIGMMKTIIGMDYERGLKMLKEYVETGTVQSRTEFAGIVDVPGCQYVGVPGECSLAGIGESMGETLPRVQQLAADNGLEVTGPPGALYHLYDMKAKHCKYTSILPVKQTNNVSGLVVGAIQPCKALKIVHRGSYAHLGNAWSTAKAHERSKKVKEHKTQCAFEFYPNDPEETPVAEILTEIYVPIRG